MLSFLAQLRQRPLLGDGAMGTLLYQRGQPLNASYDALNVAQPAVIQAVHNDYLQAGAQLIETNTFGANRLKLEKFGLSDQIAAINRRGAELAVALAHPRGAFVAGSAGPLGIDPSALPGDESRAGLYREQFEALLAGGVDVLMLETF